MIPSLPPPFSPPSHFISFSLSLCRKENNGNDPSVNLVSKPSGTGGWNSEPPGASGQPSSSQNTPRDNNDTTPNLPPRVIPAQPAPAWGGAGLPDERRRALELASREQFPTLGAAAPPAADGDDQHQHSRPSHGAYDEDERGPYAPPPSSGAPGGYSDRAPPPSGRFGGDRYDSQQDSYTSNFRGGYDQRGGYDRGGDRYGNDRYGTPDQHPGDRGYFEYRGGERGGGGERHHPPPHHHPRYGTGTGGYDRGERDREDFVGSPEFGIHPRGGDRDFKEDRGGGSRGGYYRGRGGGMEQQHRERERDYYPREQQQHQGPPPPSYRRGGRGEEGGGGYYDGPHPASRGGRYSLEPREGDEHSQTSGEYPFQQQQQQQWERERRSTPSRGSTGSGAPGLVPGPPPPPPAGAGAGAGAAAAAPPPPRASPRAILTSVATPAAAGDTEAEEQPNYFAVVRPPPPPPPPKRQSELDEGASGGYGFDRSGSDISGVDSIDILSRRATAGSSAAPSIIRSELGGGGGGDL